jgi:redox-sensitive bicupin YhaK (pirin superfamily)
LDVRPHPHIGLATVTYLFDGRVMHRDSEGNALEITPGAMNLMTAGRGIAYSERTPAGGRHGGEGLFGIQSWIREHAKLNANELRARLWHLADLRVSETHVRSQPRLKWASA